MGGCQSQNSQQEIEPFIIMWVLKVTDFLQMDLPLPKHEKLQAHGWLHRREVSSYCMFVSHQWISVEHPDPEGEQQLVLQKCLKNICDGTINVENDPASQFFGLFEKLSKQQRARLREGYIWLDWVSIPQIETFHEDDPDDEISKAKRERSARTFAYSDPVRRRRTDQEDYILSIPSFVQACQVFVALVPPLRHKDSGEVCDYRSWSTRGWCRSELWCKMMLGNQDMPVLVISSPYQAEFARPVNWVDCVPHEGAFSVASDKKVICNIFEQALSHQLSWLEHEDKSSLYRYFLARRETLIGKPKRSRTMVEFLEDFGYVSLAKSKRSNFSPVAAAALAGDCELLKLLLEAKCSMTKKFKAMPEVGIVGGLTTLHITVLQGWRSPQALKILLEARADPNLSALGVPLLACCRTGHDVELLVRHRADVCKRAWPLKVSTIALASGENTKPEVIAKLLEFRASPNGVPVGGLGITQPLSFVCVNAGSNTHAIEIVKLLLEARADVNQQCSASGVFYALEVFHRSYLQVAPARSFFMEATAEWSTSPLGIASLIENGRLVHLFMEAKGDVNLKNSRGRTPLDLAKSEDIRQILRGDQLEGMPWEAEDWTAAVETPTRVQNTQSATESRAFGSRLSPGSITSRGSNQMSSSGEFRSSPASVNKSSLGSLWVISGFHFASNSGSILIA